MAKRHILLAAAFFMATMCSACDKQNDRPPQACKTCESARRSNGWCDACNLGYVAGAQLKSKLLYETMDAHGHQLQIDALPCETCRRLAARDGYCDACRLGWVGGEAYFSRLTYEIANGEYREPDEITCRKCRTNAESNGWCDRCNIGMIGRFAVSPRTNFEAGQRDFERLGRAIVLSQSCDHCAMAAVTDTACFPCKKKYLDGFEVNPTTANH